jgi:hypothetical protein
MHNSKAISLLLMVLYDARTHAHLPNIFSCSTRLISFFSTLRTSTCCPRRACCVRACIFIFPSRKTQKAAMFSNFQVRAPLIFISKVLLPARLLLFALKMYVYVCFRWHRLSHGGHAASTVWRERETKAMCAAMICTFASQILINCRCAGAT